MLYIMLSVQPHRWLPAYITGVPSLGPWQILLKNSIMCCWQGLYLVNHIRHTLIWFAYPLQLLNSQLLATGRGRQMSIVLFHFRHYSDFWRKYAFSLFNLYIKQEYLQRIKGRMYREQSSNIRKTSSARARGLLKSKRSSKRRKWFLIFIDFWSISMH